MCLATFLCTTHLHLARGSKDLRDGCDCYKVQLEHILPVCNEGRDANLEGGVDAGGCVGGPATHDILDKAHTTTDYIQSHEGTLHEAVP